MEAGLGSGKGPDGETLMVGEGGGRKECWNSGAFW